jgi:hypothetical protein
MSFNSLSRDHEGPRGAPGAEGALSTPSLGITFDVEVDVEIAALSAFNSLSRDHRARFRDFPALRGFLPRRPFAQMIPKATI